MDIKTGLSIYNKQWLIEPNSAVQMLDFWMKMQEGGNWSYKEAKGEVPKKFFTRSKVSIVAGGSGSMQTFAGFDDAEIVVIPVSGPLMKNDYCGDLGTASLNQLTQIASNTPSVHTIVFDVDSPGGTVDGTKAFADTIKASPKRTVCLVNGLMCSAAYWIGSSADEVYASAETDIIGSIGTMCALVDATAALEKKGYVIREYYATASKDKNKMFNDAEKGDGKALISEMLDPMNAEFMSAVKENRGDKINLKSEDVLTGKTYMAQKAVEVGLIDGIRSFDEVLSIAAKTNNNTNLFIHNKKSKMTTAEIKAQHPEAYNEIYNAGVTAGATAEKDRVKSWQAWKDVDPEAVEKGIGGDAVVTPGIISEMSAKAVANAAKKKATEDNAQPVETAQAASKEKTDEEKAFDANAEALKKALNVSK